MPTKTAPAWRVRVATGCCWHCDGDKIEASANQYLRELADELHDPHPSDHETTPGPSHIFLAGRCVHCGTDDHSLPNPGETLAPWEQSCPVTGPARHSVYTVDVDGTHTFA